MTDNLHSGHRRRMLDKFHKFGVDAFNDHELLEVLLFFAMRQRDTNPLAHRLMKHFGSLHAVLEASADQLEEVEGIGPRAAEFLALSGATQRRYQADIALHGTQETRLSEPERIAAYFVPRFAGRREEVLFVAYIDNSCRVIRCDEFHSGSSSRVPINFGYIMRDAVMCSAVGVVLAHNHPNGSATPSKDDIASTQALAVHLRTLDIALIEHCIVAQDCYYSMAMGGEIWPKEEEE